MLADWGSGALVLAPLPWTPFPPALLSPRPASPAQGVSAGPEQDMARTFRGHGQDMLRTGGGHGRDPFPVTNWLGGQSRKWAPCSVFCGCSCARPRRLGPCAAIWQRWWQFLVSCCALPHHALQPRLCQSGHRARPPREETAPAGPAQSGPRSSRSVAKAVGLCPLQPARARGPPLRCVGVVSRPPRERQGQIRTRGEG